MPAIDTFGGPEQLSDPAEDGAAITPSDTVDLANITRGIYVGGAGDITINFQGSETAVLFAAVPQGIILPVRATRVKATGTTATNLVGLY